MGAKYSPPFGIYASVSHVGTRNNSYLFYIIFKVSLHGTLASTRSKLLYNTTCNSDETGQTRHQADLRSNILVTLLSGNQCRRLAAASPSRKLAIMCKVPFIALQLRRTTVESFVSLQQRTVSLSRLAPSAASPALPLSPATRPASSRPFTRSVYHRFEFQYNIYADETPYPRSWVRVKTLPFKIIQSLLLSVKASRFCFLSILSLHHFTPTSIDLSSSVPTIILSLTHS